MLPVRAPAAAAGGRADYPEAMRRVYLAATGRNHGKTTFALGLLAALLDQGVSTGFTKPVGQRYAMVGDTPADEDAILMREVFGLDDPFEDMSPVHIPRGFTKAFIRGQVVDDLGARIDAADRRLSRAHEMLLIEGTGHAGVGAVIGLSNAAVAARMRAPVVIISEGGVGRPIDHVVLNEALFAKRGVPVLGAVINKVDIEADPTLPDILRAGLGAHGIELLGVLPYRPILSRPTLAMLVEQMPGELLSSGRDMDQLIEHVAIGSGQARHVLEKIGPGSLLIVQADRGDLIRATVAATETQRQLDREPGLFDRLRNRARFGRVPDDPRSRSLAGIVFTSGRKPSTRDIEALRQSGIFSLVVPEEIYPVASQVHELLVKTHAQDRTKIEIIRQLVATSFDVGALLDRIEAQARSRATPASGVPMSRPDARAEGGRLAVAGERLLAGVRDLAARTPRPRWSGAEGADGRDATAARPAEAPVSRDSADPR
jgi:BioD-like phosphotransacetylase family protein